MTRFVDLHCHILPYVDDGALRTEESEELLDMLYQQGVRVVCATPHLRHRMFETPDDEIRLQFAELQAYADRRAYSMRLFLSREYHCDKLLQERLQAGTILCLGAGSTVLVEFSHLHDYASMLGWVTDLRGQGYQPLIAHVERYPALEGSLDKVSSLIQKGAMVQMNAGSVLGHEGMRQARWSRKLLRESLVHVIASDSHDPVDRPPELDACQRYLRKKVGDAYAEALMRDNPMQILSMIEKENIPHANNQAEAREATL